MNKPGHTPRTRLSVDFSSLTKLSVFAGTPDEMLSMHFFIAVVLTLI